MHMKFLEDARRQLLRNMGIAIAGQGKAKYF